MIAKLERVLTLLFILAAVLLLLPHLVRAAGWAERYGLTYSRLGFPVMTADGGEAVTETGDQGLLLAGWTTYDLASGGGTWVVKTGAGGAIQWQYAYLTPGVDRFLGADQAADGGYYLVGQTTSWGYGDNDGWVVKLDGAGAVQWQKAFGGTNWDELRSVAATADGGCLAVGYSYSFLTGQADTTTAWLVKLDSGGNVQWQKAFGDFDQRQRRPVGRQAHGRRRLRRRRSLGLHRGGDRLRLAGQAGVGRIDPVADRRRRPGHADRLLLPVGGRHPGRRLLLRRSGREPG